MRKIFQSLFFQKFKFWFLGVRKVFLQFLVDILPLGSGSVDLHIFFWIRIQEAQILRISMVKVSLII